LPLIEWKENSYLSRVKVEYNAKLIFGGGVNIQSDVFLTYSISSMEIYFVYLEWEEDRGRQEEGCS